MNSIAKGLGDLVKRMTTPNPFKLHIEKVAYARREGENNVLAFTRELQRAMCLDAEDVTRAEHEHVSWNVGPWRIKAHHRCFTSSSRAHPWVNTLEVVPIETDNDDRPPVDSTWYVKSKGTGSLILPPANVQAEVLALIAKEFEV